MMTYRVYDYKLGIIHLLLLCLVVLPCLCHENILRFDHVKALYVGKELRNETLLLQSGSRVYKLEGLKLHSWYEVKISYPASIPARFSVQLIKNDETVLKLNQMRRLLNTEKLIFKAESLQEVNNKVGLYVLVTVEPEGIVAIPNSEERPFVVYNIGNLLCLLFKTLVTVCEEQLMGIPYSSWSVVILVVLCLVVAFVVPQFLPSALLVKNQGDGSSHRSHGKDP